MGQRLELPKDITIKIGGDDGPGFFARVFGFIGNVIMAIVICGLLFVMALAYDTNIGEVHRSGQTVQERYGDDLSNHFYERKGERHRVERYYR